MKEITLIKEKLPYEVDEEIKTLRSTINLSGIDKKVIMITSCLSDEGKSSLSLEIAWSMAEIGKSVLLIDTDLRRSKISEKIAEGDMDIGLTNYLAGYSHMLDCFYHDVANNIHVIPAGEVPPNPAELLASEKVRDLIEKCRDVYDHIIIDTSPMGLVSDSMAVARLCDSAILLIEQGKVKRTHAKETLHKLQSTECPILGVIINKFDTRKAGYYGYYGRYGKYSRYGRYARYDRYYKK